MIVSLTINGRPVGPERWRDIEGYDGFYQVSDYGRVRSWHRGVRVAKATTAEKAASSRILYQREHKGYLRVRLLDKGKKAYRSIHSLVLSAFDGPRPPNHECAHLNGKPGQNRLWNLRWCTHQVNLLHKGKHGTQCRGSTTPSAVLNESQVAEIKRAIHSGSGNKSLGRRFGVSCVTIRSIRRGRTWRHVVLPEASQ